MKPSALLPLLIAAAVTVASTRAAEKTSPAQPAPAARTAGTRDFLKKPDAWFDSAEAKAIAANILSYQSDYGGWPKNLDLTAAPFAGQPGDLAGRLKPVLDGATTDEVRFLARMYRATHEPRYLRAVEHGLDFILIAQSPSGDWPQGYPPDRRQDRRITFHDAAMVPIMDLLREIADSEAFAFVDPDRRRAARSAARRAAAPDVGVAPPWQPRVRLALAGDSTVTDSAGWGFGFKKQVAADVLCENFAAGGQSSKSFRDSGQWQKTLASQPAYVLIQFGHNDMPGKGPNRETDPATTYAENLTRFVAEARAAGAQPILVTSLARRIFEADGKLRGELAPYAEAARKVATDQRVPLIDLYARSFALAERLGLAGVEPFEPKVLPKPAPGDLDRPTLPVQPRRDGTHLNGRGSIEFGAIVAEELRRVLPETGAYLRPAAGY